MESSKKILLTTIGIAVLIVTLVGVTYSFFNYTRTGSSNVIKVGRISFISKNEQTINLSNLFPIDPTETGIMNDATKVGTYSIEIKGDTDYVDGLEYLISTVDANITSSGKTLPISLDITVNSLGAESSSYWTARNSKNATIYKKIVGNTLEGNEMLLVGYIKPNTTSGTAEGVDGSITIKAYLDKNKILISDTYNNGETPTDNMGTPASMGEGKTVFTTSEWNALQSSGASFKIKVEANEGIWVEEPLTLFEAISRKVSTANYIASYDDFIASNQSYSTYTTQDTVGVNNNKQTVYYYNGNAANGKSNVLFAGYCWQIVRTTDNGGVRMIYNGVAEKDYLLTTEAINDTNITYTNDVNYPYTYDPNTRKWTSTNHANNSTGTFIFTVKEAGNYTISYIISSETNNHVRFYKNNSLIKYDIEINDDVVELYSLTTEDEIKIEYLKSTDNTNVTADSVTFEIGKVTSMEESEIPLCKPNRTATKGINGRNDGTTYLTNKYGSIPATVFGRSYDYDIETGMFTLEDTDGLPTSWNSGDTNNNGITDYDDLIGVYTCKSSATTCSELYYIAQYYDSDRAYQVKYTIGDLTRYGTMGTSTFNVYDRQPAKVGYMFNKGYADVSNKSDPDSVYDAIYQMTGNGSNETKARNADYQLNKKNSSIKGYLDNWYKKNLTSYTNYLDVDAIYCNDRSMSSLGNWDPNETSGNPRFNQYNSTKDLNCINETDRFAVTNYKARLTYPIGLLTEPERGLMGNAFARLIYDFYWTMSPFDFSSNNAGVIVVKGDGDYSYYIISNSTNVRGVVTLKPGTKLENGTGTYTDPYIVGPIVERDES